MLKSEYSPVQDSSSIKTSSTRAAWSLFPTNAGKNVLGHFNISTLLLFAAAIIFLSVVAMGNPLRMARSK
jgi:hypothetical protein